MLDFIILKTKLRTTPVTSLGVILDGIVRTKTDPLRKRTVLSLLLGKGALGTESLLRWLCVGVWVGRGGTKDELTEK